MTSLFKRVDYLQSVDSTNDYLKQFVKQRVPRMAVAEAQTAGKGRHGRSWHSPAKQGLYVSYLLYPNWSLDRVTGLNMISALAVARTIRLQGGDHLPISLKEPNDVLIAGKKVCGILSELSSQEDGIRWAIVGIGVNLYQKSFPGDLEHTATSLSLQHLIVDHPLAFCDTLTDHFESFYGQVEGGDWETILTEFKSMCGGGRS